jgi:hypothetical protein
VFNPQYHQERILTLEQTGTLNPPFLGKSALGKQKALAKSNGNQLSETRAFHSWYSKSPFPESGHDQSTEKEARPQPRTTVCLSVLLSSATGPGQQPQGLFLGEARQPLGPLSPKSSLSSLNLRNGASVFREITLKGKQYFHLQHWNQTLQGPRPPVFKPFQLYHWYNKTRGSFPGLLRSASAP